MQNFISPCLKTPPKAQTKHMDCVSQSRPVPFHPAVRVGCLGFLPVLEDRFTDSGPRPERGPVFSQAAPLPLLSSVMTLCDSHPSTCSHSVWPFDAAASRKGARSAAMSSYKHPRSSKLEAFRVVI